MSPSSSPVSPGQRLGQLLLDEAPWLRDRAVGVVCTPAWADVVAEDLVNTLEAAPLRSSVNVMCLWPTPFDHAGGTGVVFHCQYREKATPQDTWLVVAEGKGKPQETIAALSRVWNEQPDRLWVLAPSLDSMWVEQVRAEFPDAINHRLAFFSADQWGVEASATPAKVMPGLVLRRRLTAPAA